MAFTSALIVGLFSLPALQADDWPQWRGLHREGEWKETGILEKIPSSGLKIRWRTRIGQGYSGPAVSDGKVFVTDRKKNPDIERVVCLDEATGVQLWEHVYSCAYGDMEYGNGPRATPTVDGDRVYTLGTMGHLFCLSVAEGRVIWKKDLVSEYKAHQMKYGISAAPLVEGDLLIICNGARPDGTVMAFDKQTGEERWRALSDRPAYSAPIALTAGGCRQLIVWTADYVSSLKPETGEVYWQVKYKTTFNEAQVVATPVLQDNRLLCLSAWYRGSFMLQLNQEKPAVSEIWRTRKAPTTMLNTPHFPKGNYFYGTLSDGKFACLDATSGKEVWATEEVTGIEGGTAHITPNGDRVFLFNQRGQLILAKLTPEGYEELGRCLLVEPTAGYPPSGALTWAHPAYANKSVFARNDRELVCASLSATDSVDEIQEPGIEADLRFAKAFGKSDPTRSLAISPDGNRIAGGTLRGAIKVVDWQTAKKLPISAKLKRAVTSLVFSPDSKLLISTGGNAFSPARNNGKTIAEVKLWDVLTGTERGQLEGHTNKVLAAVFSPDGKMIATGAMDNTVRLWDVSTLKQRAVLKGHTDVVSSVAFSPDGKTLVSGSWDGMVRFWDSVSGEHRAEFEGHEDEIRCLAFSPNGSLLATGGADWKVHLWDPVTKKQRGSLVGHRGAVHSLAFSADGKILATGSGDESAKLWGLPAGKERMTLRGHESGITSLVITPNGKSLVTAGRDDGVKLWPIAGD